jgi:signal transduction histidine kinase
VNINDKIFKKYRQISWEHLNKQNCNHIKHTSIIMIMLCMLLFAYDYFCFINGLWNDNYEILFFTHISEFIMFSFFVVFFYLKKKVLFINDNLYVQIFSFCSLILCPYISGFIDERTNGQITVFIMGCFFISFFIYQRPRYAIVSYTLSFILFLILSKITQPNLQVLANQYTNAVLIVFLACFIQIKVSGFMVRNYIYKNHLEDIVSVRTEELKNSLEKIQRLDRLDLVGKMAAIVGHEIRNPLTTIRGFLQLQKLKKQMYLEPEYLDLMLSEVDRANDIISDFLSICRNKATVMDIGNITQIVNLLKPIINADAISRDMLLITDLKPVQDIMLNQQEITQLILNLIRNGFEAMTKGGHLTISTYQTNEEVILQIKDKGSGIPQEALDKLGTPFFTTKDSGIGLGLVVCNSIVERHNGRIDIQSSHNNGSAFKVHFKIPDEEQFPRSLPS